MTIPHIEHIRTAAQIFGLEDEHPHNLRARVHGVLAGLHIGPDCVRCYGTGIYRETRTDNKTCYSCGGRGTRIPCNTDEWGAALKAARTAASDGSLAAHREKRRLASQAGRACNEVLRAWKQSGVSRDYRWREAQEARKALRRGESITPGAREHLRVSNINGLMSDAYAEIRRLANSKRPEDFAKVPAATARAKQIVQAAAVLSRSTLLPLGNSYTLGDLVFIPCHGGKVAVVSDGDYKTYATEKARTVWRSVQEQLSTLPKSSCEASQ